MDHACGQLAWWRRFGLLGWASFTGTQLSWSDCSAHSNRPGRIPIDAIRAPGANWGPPLKYVRSVTASIYDDDRWRFETHGEVQPFEDLVTYRARRIRDRFDRTLLIRYLDALGISSDDPAFFRSAVLFEAPTTPRWTASIAEARKEQAPVGKHR
jgi:hypothetical protein